MANPSTRGAVTALVEGLKAINSIHNMNARGCLLKDYSTLREI